MNGPFRLLTAHLEGETAALSAALLWAVATVIYGRVGKQIRPLELNLAKNILAIVMLLLTLMPRAETLFAIEPFALGLLLLSGAVGIGLGDTAYFESLRWLGARRVLLLSVLAPPLAGLIALIFLGENLSMTAWSGIVVTVLGIAWVISERVPTGAEGSTHLFRGVSFGVVAALTQATGVVLSRAALTQTGVSPLLSALVRLVGGVVILIIWIPLTRQPLGRWVRLGESRRLLGAIVFATFIGTYLAIWLQQVSLTSTDAGIAQTLFSTSPLFVLPIVARMGEVISLRAVAGAIVALAGIALLLGLT